MIDLITPTLLLLLPAMTFAADGEADSRAALEAYLGKTPGAQAGRLLPVKNEVVSRAFPGHHIYAVRFRGYPVKPPKSFKASNLFAVTNEGAVKRLPDEKSLHEFFRDQIAKVTDDSQAKTTLRAWLRLAEELHQDGYYTFKTDEDSLAVRLQDGKRVASGKAVVTGGGEGWVSSKLTFNDDGKLAETSMEAKLKPDGARPMSGKP